ncbi:hypothetical protein [Methylobacterium sp. 17Sr1-1]|uniref:hypothetical protein n=1 Tax=Methylobacterium sp. 17Sr1-1 TaxID=2202826 RepID=UPI0013A53D07|nr:hypothetical protein [Methylobacterium sp. 17Sr1-1]
MVRALRHVRSRARPRRVDDAPDADAVGEDDEIELRRLRDLRQTPVMSVVDTAASALAAGERQADVVAAWMQERAQMRGAVATRPAVSLARRRRIAPAGRTGLTVCVHLNNHFYVLYRKSEATATFRPAAPASR